MSVRCVGPCATSRPLILIAGSVLFAATVGCLLPCAKETFEGSEATARCEAPSDPPSPKAPRNTDAPSGDATPRIAIEIGDAFVVDGRWAMDQGTLGEEPTVQVETHVRYRVEVLAQRGERLQVRVTPLQRVERVNGVSTPQPLAPPRELSCAPDRLALVAVPDGSRALGLPLPRSAPRAGDDWERKGTVSLLGLPVATHERFETRQEGTDLLVVLTGEGRGALPGTDLDVRLTSEGTSVFDPRQPAWPRSVDCSYRWEVHGGGDAPAASHLTVELTCAKEQA